MCDDGGTEVEYWYIRGGVLTCKSKDRRRCDRLAELKEEGVEGENTKIQK